MRLIKSLLLVIAILSSGCLYRERPGSKYSKPDYTGAKNLDYNLAMGVKDLRHRVDELVYLRKEWQPVNEEYEDAVHSRFYRLINYQIVRYGGKADRQTVADDALLWLIDSDPVIQ